MRMMPVSHMCSLGSSTAATWRQQGTAKPMSQDDAGLLPMAQASRTAGRLLVWAGTSDVMLPMHAGRAVRAELGTHLQDVEGGGVEEVEGEEGQAPHQLVHARDAPAPSKAGRCTVPFGICH
jgi:hypothetical protein